MTNRFFGCVALLLGTLVSGCVTEPQAAGGAAVDVESVATSELAAVQTCFTCVLDPSVRACSSIASRAQHVCDRACVVCDFGVCFHEPCEPE